MKHEYRKQFPEIDEFSNAWGWGFRYAILVPNCDLAMPLTLSFGAFSFFKKKLSNNAVVCAPP
jgi:hypothetical protein